LTQPFAKPCVNDEDNAASLYRDDDGWTIHRKRAWMAVMSQTHYDYNRLLDHRGERGRHARLEPQDSALDEAPVGVHPLFRLHRGPPGGGLDIEKADHLQERCWAAG